MLIHIAEIAGVFVGFGALIAVRGGGASDAFEIAWMRGVVSLGLVAVFAALAPAIISRYGLTEHEVLALSSILALVGLGGFTAINWVTPEARVADERIRRSILVVRLVFWVPWMIFILLAPIVIVLGMAPDLEEALYTTVVALFLLWSAVALLWLVFRGRAPAGA